MSKKKTQTAQEISLKAANIGDTLNDRFEKNGNIEEGLGAIKAYNTSLKAQKDRLIYQKLMNTTIPSPFYE